MGQGRREAATNQNESNLTELGLKRTMQTSDKVTLRPVSMVSDI